MSIERITFEAGSQLTKIGYAAFAGCENLVEIEFPASVIAIPDDCFGWMCPGPWPSGVKGEWNYCPESSVCCSSLCSVTFAPGSSLEHIGSGAFSRCTSLKELVIPAGVEHIDLPGMFVSTALLGRGREDRPEEGGSRFSADLVHIRFEAGSSLQEVNFESVTVDSWFSYKIGNFVVEIPDDVEGVCASDKETHALEVKILWNPEDNSTVHACSGLCVVFRSGKLTWDEVTEILERER